jgi:hypothetical protein
MFNSRLIIAILLVISIFSIATGFVFTYSLQGESLVWFEGFFQNFGTEILGALVIFIILELVVSERQNKPRSDSHASYSQRIAKLTNELNNASQQVELLIISEMQKETNQQESIISTLQARLSTLNERKDALESTIQQLENIKDASPLVNELFGQIDQKLQSDNAADERKHQRSNLRWFAIGLLASIPANILSNIIQSLLNASPPS